MLRCIVLPLFLYVCMLCIVYCHVMSVLVDKEWVTSSHGISNPQHSFNPTRSLSLISPSPHQLAHRNRR